MGMMKAILLFMTIGVSCNARVPNRPAYIQCQSNSECSLGTCCTLGANKFSIPQCNPLQEEGSNCRPQGHETINTTLVYPDGTEVEVTDVHYILCPCSYGLTCDSKEGICKDPSYKRGFNDLLGNPSTEDD